MHAMDIAGLTKATAAIVSLVAAVGLGFRRREEWEPCEQELPTAPQKVGSAIAAASIAVLFASFNDSDKIGALSRVTLIFALSCGVSLLLYVLLNAAYVWEVPDGRKKKKIIVGFFLTKSAQEARQSGMTRAELFERLGASRERIWTHRSTILAKIVFTLIYLCLTISGTLAVTSAGLLTTLRGPIPVTVTVRGDSSLCPQTVNNRQLKFTVEGDIDFAREYVLGSNKYLLPKDTADKKAKLFAVCGRMRSDTDTITITYNAEETLFLNSNDAPIAKILKDGQDAFFNGQYTTARERALDALTVIPGDPQAVLQLSAANRAIYSETHLF
jgi:hypothetical protein